MHCISAYIIRQLLKLFALYLQVPSAVAAVVESAAVRSKKKNRNKKPSISVTPSPSEMATAAGGDGGEPTSSVQLQPSSNYASSRSCNTFAENCFLIASAGSQHQVGSQQLFQCRDLVGHTESIAAMEFSGDGSFIVSGSLDGTVRLWSIREEKDGTQFQLMEAKQKSVILCVAISSDNSSIFSTGFETAVFIHDTHT